MEERKDLGQSSRIIQGDCLEAMKTLEPDSVDAVITDPPYGYSFMAKDWDKAVPSVDIWRECLRVLKPGAFACVMSAPRSDVQMHMIQNLTEAGFRLDFTPIYWTYASGFPKAMNIGKAAESKVLNGTGNKTGFQDLVGEKEPRGNWGISKMSKDQGFRRADYSADTTKQRTTKVNYQTPEAKALDGSYAGFQPKPAVEVIIVAMKPLSEKTFVDQALKNGKGITWLDDVRIPYDGQSDWDNTFRPSTNVDKNNWLKDNNKMARRDVIKPSGRFPANLLVSDDVLNDGREIKGGYATGKGTEKKGMFGQAVNNVSTPMMDSGSYSRYFDLDRWASTLPFLIVPKASKGEKNKGLDNLPDTLKLAHMRSANGTGDKNFEGGFPDTITKNHHPTVKPLKLMSYLVMLFTREGDTVLDPFLGSGTTALAAKKLGRKYIGIELNEEYVEIAQARLDDKQEALF